MRLKLNQAERSSSWLVSFQLVGHVQLRSSSHISSGGKEALVKTLVTAAFLTMALTAPASAQTSGSEHGDPRPPDAFLASSYGEVRGELRAYCWPESSPTGTEATVCADRFGPIDPAVALTVETGGGLTLRFDRPISPTSITVQVRESPNSWGSPPGSDPIHTFGVQPGNPAEFRADFAPGTYFLTVFTTWGEGDERYGDAVYEFEISVLSRATTACKPGHGRGDRNHCHTGPPGRANKRIGGDPPGHTLAARRVTGSA
ncbi:MAG: hypothetical protein M3163_01950 [Actinomycetota bacterium]|nr:hypothetical protein [Actinomycetota bacterium]